MINISNIVRVFLIVFLIANYDVQGQKVINAADFGMQEDCDATPVIIKALKECKDRNASKLIIPKGTYQFYSDYGTEQYFFVSNNDEGLKRIIFPLFDLSGLTIDGQGSRFIFHGFINPFIVSHSSNIILTNFSIDFDRPFHSEGIILSNDPDGVVVRIHEESPYKVSNGLLIFTGKEDGSQIYGYGNLLEFDTQKRETAYMALDHYFLPSESLPAKDLGDHKVKIFFSGLKGTVGNTLVFGPSHRKYPAVVLSDSKDVKLLNIEISHAGGMGVIAQRMHNVMIGDCKVTPSGNRMISTTADATHFVNCTGKIVLDHNLFENQLDDATNIHGIYIQIKDVIADDELIVELKHPQQYGFDFLKPSTDVEFVKGLSMITYSRNTVKSVERLNKQLTRVKFEKPLGDEVKAGDAIAELRDYPQVLITNNTIRDNRARGILLNCRGKTVVENNLFHTPGAALLFEGDAFYWFEQGGVRDCVIRNNTFDNCMYGVWGRAIIDVSSGVRGDLATSRYHKNIRIEDNIFKVFDDIPLLHAYCVDGLMWKGNKVERTNGYSARIQASEKFEIYHCDHVDIEK